MIPRSVRHIFVLCELCNNLCRQGQDGRWWTCFFRIPKTRLGNTKEKVLEGTTSRATCPLKLTEFTLPGIGQRRTVNPSSRDHLFIKPCPLIFVAGLNGYIGWEDAELCKSTLGKQKEWWKQQGNVPDWSRLKVQKNAARLKRFLQIKQKAEVQKREGGEGCGGKSRCPSYLMVMALSWDWQTMCKSQFCKKLIMERSKQSCKEKKE